jgi:hypothetical protein
MLSERAEDNCRDKHERCCRRHPLEPEFEAHHVLPRWNASRLIKISWLANGFNDPLPLSA